MGKIREWFDNTGGTFEKLGHFGEASIAPLSKDLVIISWRKHGVSMDG